MLLCRCPESHLPPSPLSYLPFSTSPKTNPHTHNTVCPSCSNVLTVSQAPAEGGNPVNRLECLTCPYQFLLTKRYFERKTFTRAEREDVFGGPGAWDNAQKQQGVQCPKEGCEGEEAAYFQVQIRSADEPMTSFYKVSVVPVMEKWGRDGVPRTIEMRGFAD